MYLNKAIIYGNIVRDPDIKALPSGSKVCSFSVATNRVWKDQNGAKKESVDYHNVVVFGRQAETSGQYLKKGSGVFVEGRMQTRSWDGQDGQKKYRTEVVADRIQFGPRSGSASGAQSNNASGAKSNESQDELKDNAPLDTIDYPAEEINPDDIPF